MVKRRKYTQKASKRRRNQSRKQRGGLGNNLKFQYTMHEGRGLWTEAMYPLANLVLKNIKQIPWASYRFEGLTTLYTEIPQEDENLSPSAQWLAEPKIEHIETHIIGTCQKIPYAIIGGAACELWNKAYPKVANLHKTTDPSADIDIELSPPTFQVDDTILEKYGDISIVPLYSGYYSPFIDHYTRWIFQQVVALATRIAPYFGKQFTAPYKHDTPETQYSDRYEYVGPILVTRSLIEDMIKIQMTTKLKSGYADHFLEFILPIDDFKNKYQSKPYFTPSTIYMLDGLYIQNVYTLLERQLAGLKGRMNIEVANRHKLINHYGRALYLTQLLEYTQQQRIGPQLGITQLRLLLQVADDGLFDPKEGVCPPPKGCSAEAYRAPLDRLIAQRLTPSRSLAI